MELDAIEGALLVRDGHDSAVWGCGVYVESVFYGIPLCHEGMIAGDGKGGREVLKQPLACVGDGGHFPMHGTLALLHRAAKGVSQDLVSQTDAENGDLSAIVFHDLEGDCGLFWLSGARGDDDAPYAL